MFRFGLKNMRRLKEVPLLEIKPITILVGRNSSGKSTFLRTFPLIRQSITTRTSSPILWYGDLVDFGEFASVVSGRNLDDCITLSFGVDEVTFSPSFFSSFYRPGRDRIKAPIDVDLAMSGDSGKAKLESIKVSFRGLNKDFLMEIAASGELKTLYFNERDITALLSPVTIRFSPDALFPDLIIRTKEQKSVPNYQWLMSQHWGAKVFTEAVSPFINQRMKEDKITRFAQMFLEMSEFSDNELLKLERRLKQRTTKDLINHVRTSESPVRQELRAVYEIWKVFELLPSVFAELTTLMSKTLYIGPMRARSERYYRYQDLAVAEIDPDGKNFPMFLNSLTAYQRQSFSEWVNKQFGYGVEVKSESGHISINLVFGTEKSNIVDNGYGISQVLPVLGQIWWASHRFVFPPPEPIQTTIVIEQPELHLHPAHQALLADAIISERGNSDNARLTNITFVVETHSEALVNRLGQLIADGRVPHDDVQVLVFEDDTAKPLTSVRIATFDKRGALQNWPFGFFQPEAE